MRTVTDRGHPLHIGHAPQFRAHRLLSRGFADANAGSGRGWIPGEMSRRTSGLRMSSIARVDTALTAGANAEGEGCVLRKEVPLTVVCQAGIWAVHHELLPKEVFL